MVWTHEISVSLGENRFYIGTVGPIFTPAIGASWTNGLCIIYQEAAVENYSIRT